jgi:hypothetical protein
MGLVPRRWSVEVGGIRWLPRMIDKARMSANGTLGAYLIGHSPVDKALLERLGVTTQEFVRIAATEPDDAGVLAALSARPGFDEARVRRWSDHFERTYRFYIRLWDLDEGYARPNPIERTLGSIYHVFEGPISALLRKLLPAP